MHRGSFLGILLGLIAGEKENTPENNVLSVAAGNMLARDLHDMSDDLNATPAGGGYLVTNSNGGLIPGQTVAAPSPNSITRDLVGEYVGVEEYNRDRIVVLIDGIHHSFDEPMVKAIG